MAKKNTAEPGTELVVFPQYEEMIVLASKDLVETTIGTNEALETLKQTYGELTVNGITDMAGYKLVAEGISKLRNIRTGVEKRRKELTEPALEFQRRLKAEADRITSEIAPIEERLKAEKIRIDDAKETARREEFQRRVTLLTENAWTLAGGFYVCGALQIHPDEIVNLDEEQLQRYLDEGKREIERREAEAKRKAQEEERRKAEEAQLQAEREAIAAERAELARLKAEIEAQKQAIEKTYETVVQPEPASQEQPQSQPAPQVNIPKPTAPAQAQPTTPQAQARQIPIVNENAPVGHTHDFMLGWDMFRMALLGLLKDNTRKFTRAELIAWAEGSYPPPNQ